MPSNNSDNSEKIAKKTKARISINDKDLFDVIFLAAMQDSKNIFAKAEEIATQKGLSFTKEQLRSRYRTRKPKLLELAKAKVTLEHCELPTFFSKTSVTTGKRQRKKSQKVIENDENEEILSSDSEKSFSADDAENDDEEEELPSKSKSVSHLQQERIFQKFLENKEKYTVVENELAKQGIHSGNITKEQTQEIRKSISNNLEIITMCNSISVVNHPFLVPIIIEDKDFGIFVVPKRFANLKISLDYLYNSNQLQLIVESEPLINYENIRDYFNVEFSDAMKIQTTSKKLNGMLLYDIDTNIYMFSDNDSPEEVNITDDNFFAFKLRKKNTSTIVRKKAF